MIKPLDSAPKITRAAKEKTSTIPHPYSIDEGNNKKKGCSPIDKEYPLYANKELRTRIVKLATKSFFLNEEVTK